MYLTFTLTSRTGLAVGDHGRGAVSIPPDHNAPFTDLQGQYLAFIHAYTQVNGRAPAETDLQRYFRVSAPSVHQMLVTLTRKGLIRRVPGQARTIELLLDASALPRLR
jgi:SOS-response transcriptional repressor LexA